MFFDQTDAKCLLRGVVLVGFGGGVLYLLSGVWWDP